jgi:hypothetical protein
VGALTRDRAACAARPSHEGRARAHVHCERMPCRHGRRWEDRAQRRRTFGQEGNRIRKQAIPTRLLRIRAQDSASLCNAKALIPCRTGTLLGSVRYPLGLSPPGSSGVKVVLQLRRVSGYQVYGAACFCSSHRSRQKRLDCREVRHPLVAPVLCSMRWPSSRSMSARTRRRGRHRWLRANKLGRHRGVCGDFFLSVRAEIPRGRPVPVPRVT